jgi:hypothetical protein
MINRHFSRWIVAGTIAAVTLATALPGEAQQRRASAQQLRASAQVGPYCVHDIGDLFDGIEVVPLTAEDEERVLFLREEEKLSRDVYLTLFDRWQLPIFSNIANAEQRHMDLVLRMIETYGLEDPVDDDTVGVFADLNFDFSGLFGELTDRGVDTEELTDALTVGAEIEEESLCYLYEVIDTTDSAHLALVAHNLATGSRNHLRAFVRALTAQEAAYEPGCLDPETFEAVFEAEMEQRMFRNAGGEPVPACGAAVGGFGMRRGPGSGGQDNGGGNDNGGGSDNGDGNGGGNS